MQLTPNISRVRFKFQPRNIAYLLVGFSALYAIYMLWSVPRWTVDDAYISFRYAYNLVHYGELNWNVGYDPVEGYTGITLPLLLVPVIALGGDPALASQVLGLLSYIACSLLLWRISGQLALPILIRALIQALFFITPALFTHVFAGLETMLFTALLLGSFSALLQRADTTLPILLLFTSLTRPEGALLAVLFLGARLLQSWRETHTVRTILIKITLLYLLPGGCYFLWRWFYYGYPLPNTFYVKASNGQINDTALQWTIAHLLFPLIALLISAPTLARFKPYSLALSAFLVFAITLTLLYSRTTLVMNYGYRFYMPLYPLCLVVLGTLAGYEQRKTNLLMLALIPIVAQATWCSSLLATNERNWIVSYRDTLIHEHLATAEYIKTHIPQDEWLILNDTGIMPYLTQRKTIDSGGLNDEFLAHIRDKQAINTYLKSFHAGAITIAWFEGSDELGLDPFDFIPEPGSYQLITDYKDPDWLATYKGFRVYLFVRNDLIK